MTDYKQLTPRAKQHIGSVPTDGPGRQSRRPANRSQARQQNVAATASSPASRNDQISSNFIL